MVIKTPSPVFDSVESGVESLQGHGGHEKSTPKQTAADAPVEDLAKGIIVVLVHGREKRKKFESAQQDHSYYVSCSEQSQKNVSCQKA